MGIPAFYRWLVERYPRVVADVVDETPATVNGVDIPIDTSKPNPNGVEFHNLYLDMNGIIHPCFHPEGLPAPKTYDEVFTGVFKYIDRIFSMIRPRKLLFMAIDGVAPRAKMNQQRSRRFKAAKDAADEASKEETLEGDVMGGEGKVTKMDSNIITPGTEFMELLSSALQYYIHLRMNSDPGWQGIKVILSDASVPGEGEHKIMSYIRSQRNLPGFDPNTRHCLYGLDADLIMLALATHEIHFSVLREDVRKEPPKNKSTKRDNYSSQLNKTQEIIKSGQGEEYVMYLEDLISRQRFQFLNIWVLRDYLGHELCIPDPEVKVDLERLIDDFVFMCLFVGNDFLPHVPSLEISEGAIDLLMMVYKKEFIRMGGYLTNSSQVNLECVEHFVQAVGAHENGIFRKRNEARKEWEIHLRRRSAVSSFKGIGKSMNHVYSEALVSVDKVKLGEDGWKERYYFEKFEVQSSDEYERLKRNAVFKYVEGICWVMHYYYQGVCSWNWFYPYHYAPFASDFQGLNQLEINFLLGKPFKPFDQLMGVLPAASAQALPLSYRKLMTDPCSPILDFYPSDFELDMNGKRHAWQAVCKLPFIEELRLLSEIEKVEHTLTDHEKKRNGLSLDQLFVHKLHRMATKIFSFSERNKNHPKLYKLKLQRKIDPKFSDGMNGYILISNKPVCPIEIFSPINGMELITKNEVVSAFYKLPSPHPHIAKPPKGLKLPKKSVSKRHVKPPPVPWHEKTAVVSNRISVRRIPPRSISGTCLTKLAHQLVSKSCQVKQKGSSSDGCKNNSEVKRREENSQMGQKDGYVDGESENNSDIRKREQNCQLEQKDGNVDGNSKGNSLVRKREEDVPGATEKKRKKRKKNRNNKDKGTENNSEVGTREQNYQVNQKDCIVDGESENNSKVQQREQNLEVEQKDKNPDASSEKNSQVGKREQDMPTMKEEDRNDINKGTENKSEFTMREQNCQVDQKDTNVDGECENSSIVRKREQNCQVEEPKDSNVDGSSERNSEGRKRQLDMVDDQIVRKKRKKNKTRDTTDKGSENNSEVGTREKNYQVNQMDCIVDEEIETNSKVGQREQNLEVEQKDNNPDASSEKISQVGKREQDTATMKDEDRNDLNKGTENKSEFTMREQNCQVDQKDSNVDVVCENNFIVRKREQNCQVEPKDSNVAGSSEINSEGRERQLDMVDDQIVNKRRKKRKKNKTRDNTDKGSENNSEVLTREQNCQVDEKESNAGASENISEVGKIRQNLEVEQKYSNVDGVGEQDSEVKKRRRDMPDDKIAKKKNRDKKRKLNNASNASAPEASKKSQPLGAGTEFLALTTILS